MSVDQAIAFFVFAIVAAITPGSQQHDDLCNRVCGRRPLLFASALGLGGQAITFGAVFFAAALPSGLVWLALGTALHRLLQDERVARVFNIVMGPALQRRLS